jgi:hypothetical protein
VVKCAPDVSPQTGDREWPLKTPALKSKPRTSFQEPCSTEASKSTADLVLLPERIADDGTALFASPLMLTAVSKLQIVNTPGLWIRDSQTHETSLAEFPRDQGGV